MGEGEDHVVEGSSGVTVGLCMPQFVVLELVGVDDHDNSRGRRVVMTFVCM